VKCCPVTAVKKNWYVFPIAILIVLLTTYFAYRVIDGRLPQNRLVILAYETTITGSEAEDWETALAEKHTELDYVDVQVYLAQGANLTSYASGWDQIVTLLANGCGDILLLDEEHFTYMAQNNYLLPLTGQNFGEKAVYESNTNGVEQLLGVEVQGIYPYGLRYLENAASADLYQPKMLVSADGNKIYAAIYAGTTNQSAVLRVFAELFGDVS